MALFIKYGSYSDNQLIEKMKPEYKSAVKYLVLEITLQCYE